MNGRNGLVCIFNAIVVVVFVSGVVAVAAFKLGHASKKDLALIFSGAVFVVSGINLIISFSYGETWSRGIYVRREDHPGTFRVVVAVWMAMFGLAVYGLVHSMVA